MSRTSFTEKSAGREKDLEQTKEGSGSHIENNATLKTAESVHSMDDTSPTYEKSLVRKLDMTVMPTVFILYLFNYLDRNNIAQAKLDTFEQDLGLKGDQFNLLLSIINVSYILMQIPSNMILTRARPSLYIPFWVCAWSCVSAATAACHNFSGIVAVRFFLGIAEAPFFPGVFYLLSCWYTREELALRYAILYCGLILATAVSGLLAAGIFAGMSGVSGLAGWRWLFIIEGAISFSLGVIAFFLLPNFPSTMSSNWLFTAQEIDTARLRMARDAVSNQEGNRSVFHGLKLAVTDIKVWLFALILCSIQSAYGFNYFYPSIVEGFGLGTRTITLLCTAPPYFLSAATSSLNSWHSDRRGERGFHIVVPMLVATTGFIISVATVNVPARYVASFLYVCGCFGANAILYSWAAVTVNQTPEKKAVATAMINVIGQLGSIWSPYFFDPTDSPRYTRAMILLMAFALFETCLCFLMKFILRKENKKMIAEFQGTGRVPNVYTT